MIPKIAAVAAAAILAASCCPCRSYQKKTRRPLVGTEWQLVQLGGRSVQPQADRFHITFQSEEGRITGVGACNRVFGPFEEGEKRALRIGPLASTMMACPDMKTEREFTEALEATTHYDMDGPILLLLSNSGRGSDARRSGVPEKNHPCRKLRCSRGEIVPDRCPEATSSSD